MMEEIKAILEGVEIDQVIQMVLSKASTKQAEITKIKYRPVKLKGELWVQETKTIGPKELHRNLEMGQVRAEIEMQLEENFKQALFVTSDMQWDILISKKGKVSIKAKKNNNQAIQVLDHNRKKQYLLEEGQAVPFLIELGVMTKDGKVVKSRYDKFRQINRYLELVEDIVDQLPKGRTITIIDFGCGKSYLTFALYYYLQEKKNLPIQVIGLDLKEDVIAHCNALAENYGYSNLKFLVGDIANYQAAQKVDMVVTLHACDTATDYALEKAIKWDAEVILTVPCCQHEVNQQIKNDLLQPVFKYGLLQERIASLLTDGIRANLLEEMGYDTQVLEFIDMEHTPKNILIRATKKNNAKKQKKKMDIKHMTKDLHVYTTLQKLLEESNQNGELD